MIGSDAKNRFRDIVSFKDVGGEECEYSRRIVVEKTMSAVSNVEAILDSIAG